MTMAVVLLLVLFAGASSVYVDRRCGNCTCTFYEDGCVKANCTSRNISSLSEILPKVPNHTCILLMRNNSIQTLQTGVFQRFVKLSQLDLSGNQIKEIHRNAFAGIPKLVALNLTNNEVDFESEAIAPDVFKPLQNLKELELKWNPYDTYPDYSLSELPSLEHLSLDGQQNQSFGPGFLPLKNLSSIDISGIPQRKCNISSLYMSTFDHIKTIKLLNISHCNISYVEPGTFTPLQNIETLDLSHNENLLFHGVHNVTKGLQTSNLRRLVINKIVPDYAVCVVIDATLVEYLENTSLEVIEADDNRIEQLSVEALSRLPKSLNDLSLRKSRFTTGPYLKHLDLLSNLTSLDLSGDQVSRKLLHDFVGKDFEYDYHYSEAMNGFCQSQVMNSGNEMNDNELLPPSSRKRNVMSTLFSSLNAGKQDKIKVKIPQQLKTLNFSFSELSYHLSDIYLEENSLELINLSCNVLTIWPGPVFGVENITHLDLSNNFAQFVNFTFFENFKSLTFLNLSMNYLSRSIFHDKNGTLFRNLSNLETLDLSYNDIILLPYRFLEGLNSLKTLIIYENNFVTLKLNYTSNTKLKFINASDNSIGYIPEMVRDTLDNLAVKNNLSVDLSWNPFECTCDPEHLRFLDWVYTTKVNMLNTNRYMCAAYNSSGRYLKSLHKIYPHLKEECKIYIALAMGLLSVVVVITTATLCGVVYRYRWKLMYLYYVGKRKIFWKRTTYETIYDFDAFVSYADKDLEFVRPLMTSRLESDQGLSLYIRDRDSMPGAAIADNIIDGIQRSKLSILLISKASLARKWCRYEFEMTNMEEISTKRNMMILVMLESVPCKDIPSEKIMKLIEKNPPLQYPADDPTQTESFWANLLETIRT